MALKAADAEDLVATAAAQGKLIMVGHLLEYHPGVRKVKELLEAGELGKTFYVYANRLNLGKVRADENALWSLGPHDISVINYLTGEEPEEVSARGECYLQDGVEDVVFGYIKYPSGMIGHLHVSWLDPHKSRKITVVGSNKMVVFDDMEADRKVTVYEKGATTTRAKFEDYGEFVTLRFGDIHIPKISNEEPLKIECQHFVDCIREGRQPLSDGRDGLNVVRVLEAMERSLRNGGQPVKTADLTGRAG
jgi:predicted dehydrogenase